MKQKHYHGNSNRQSMSGRIAAATYDKYRRQLDVCLQMGLDAAMIAANEVLGLGAGRAAKFRKAYIDTINEIGRMLAIDGKDDADLTYSTAKIDERLRQIVGNENFVDWDGRYGK